MTYDDFDAWARQWRQAQSGQGDAREAARRLDRLIRDMDRPPTMANRSLLRQAAAADDPEQAWRRLTQELDQQPSLSALRETPPGDRLAQAAADGVEPEDALPTLDLPTHPYLVYLYRQCVDEVLEPEEALASMHSALPYLTRVEDLREAIGALKTIGLPMLDPYVTGAGPTTLAGEHVDLVLSALEVALDGPPYCVVCQSGSGSVADRLHRVAGAPRLALTCDECGAIAEFDAGALGLLDAGERLVSQAEARARLERLHTRPLPVEPLPQRRLWNAWVRVPDFGRWLPAETQRMDEGDLIAFAYIDRTCGLTLHAEAVVAPDDPTELRWCYRRAQAFVRYRHGTLPERAWELVPPDLCERLGLPRRPDWLGVYEEGAPLEARAVTQLDPFRAPAHPDDVQLVLLPPAHAPHDLKPEQLWLRIESFVDGKLKGTLRNEPFEDFGLRFGDTVEANFDPTEPGRAPWLVAAEHIPP